MAWPFTCRTFPQNPPFSGKDEPAGAAFTKANNTPAVSRAPTAAIAPPLVSILSSVALYLEYDLQQILRTVLDSRPPASPLAPALQQYKNPCERLLKVRLPDCIRVKLT